MTIKDQDKKPRAGKSQVKKVKASKSEGKPKDSIGFLGAARKAHISVIEIPLTFFADLGIAEDKIKSAKTTNKKFIVGMYERLDGFTTIIGDTFSAPGKFVGSMVDKLQEVTATKEPVAKPKQPRAKSVKSKPKVKASVSKAKLKTAAAKPKTKPKARARKAKLKTGTPRPMTVSKAAPSPKSTKKAIAAASSQSKLGADAQLSSV